MLSCALLLAASALPDATDVWKEPRRGSWIREDGAMPGDCTLVGSANSSLAIVVGRDENSYVRKAADVLAGDIERITGVHPRLTGTARPGDKTIELVTRKGDSRWEAYAVTVHGRGIRVEGSNPRGTAFGAYELCERLGVDPLIAWSGLSPRKRMPLIVKGGRYAQEPPVVRYRGLFHDDEDILPRPKGADGAPLVTGRVPMEWYERFFETALRLRMNMVAPWVRVEKPFEVQKLASDWGLYYTSHHYDTLLSDPFHFGRGLAEKRGVEKRWDWATNREGMIRFWQGGVDENKDLSCIWPVGMRGTDDYSYQFPETWSQAQKVQAYSDAIKLQTEMVKRAVPAPRERLFHFTMYTEMLPFYQTGQLVVPEDVIIVWPDDNDGRMRGLPAAASGHRHGVYYHLAYFGGAITKQTHQTVPPERIESEFRRILEAGANEYCLVNVSELREYVLGVRMIADIEWNGIPPVGGAERFMDWWCREYFGSGAERAKRAYDAYFALMPEAGSIHYGSDKCLGAIRSLRLKLEGKPFSPALPDTLPTLKQRWELHESLRKLLDDASASITDPEQRRFLFENLGLAAAVDRLPTRAAISLVEAMSEPDRAKTAELCRQALVPLDEMELSLRRAERWPFDGWYGPSWIRPRNDHLIEPRRQLIELLIRS